MDATDSELMLRLAAGDDLALNVLMDRWSKSVASFLHKMTGNRDTAVDLAQETFVKLYHARERYRPGGNFSTYLFAIASNLARNQARWKGRHPTVSMEATQEDGTSVLPEMADMKQTPEEAARSAEKFRAVHEAFLCLSLELREAMTLFVYEGMGYAEIAVVAGCSTKAVETRIYRARQILKERLSEFVQ
jgi:RNA polymerase sigma-70 factor (ECF subfamily)